MDVVLLNNGNELQSSVARVLKEREAECLTSGRPFKLEKINLAEFFILRRVVVTDAGFSLHLIMMV